MSTRRAHHRELISARVGSLVLDSLLIAYAMWCGSFLQAHFGGRGMLQRYPGLALVAVVLAVVWQMSGTSLGQRAYRLRFVDAEGRPSGLSRRTAWAFWAALNVALLVLPFAVMDDPLSALAFSCCLALVLGLGTLLRADGRSNAEILAPLRLTIERQEDTSAIPPWYARPNVWVVLGLLGLTFAVGAVVTDISLTALIENVDRTRPMISNLLDPDWSIAGRVIEKLIETVFLALMASALSLPFAFVLSFFGARNLTRGSGWGRLAYALARMFMNITRSIEPLIWGIIFIVWVGVGPYAGMLALFIHSVAALGKLYSEAIESIDPGPVEAIQATGASYVQTLRFGVVPQVIPPFLSFTVYRWDINVRMATILGLIGGGGIGNLLIDYTQLGAWNKLGTVIIFITLVVWLMDIASAKARERLS